MCDKYRLISVQEVSGSFFIVSGCSQLCTMLTT